MELLGTPDVPLDFNGDDFDVCSCIVCQAAARGLVGALRFLVQERRADVRGTHSYLGWVDVSALYYAVSYGHPDAVKVILLEGGADPNGDVFRLAGADGTSALATAAFHGQPDVAWVLVELGARAVGVRCEHEGPLLSEVCSVFGDEDLVLELLRRDPITAEADESGWSMLHAVCLAGMWRAAEVILAARTGMARSTDGRGWTVAHAAAQGEGADARALDLLAAAGADLDSPTSTGRTPLLIALQEGRAEMARELLARGASPDARVGTGETVLYCACEGGVEDVVRARLDSGAEDARMARADGQTALVVAARGGHERVTRLLLDRGADPNAFGRRGRTPLSAAAEHCHVSVMRLLLAAGAVTNDSAVAPSEPDLALAMLAGSADAAALLLDAGADPAGFATACHFLGEEEGSLALVRRVVVLCGRRAAEPMLGALSAFPEQARVLTAFMNGELEEQLARAELERALDPHVEVLDLVRLVGEYLVAE